MDNSKNTAVSAPPTVKKPMSQRFTEMVLREYAVSATQSGTQLSAMQRRIIQGYFLVIDCALRKTEEDRIRKNKSNSDHSYDNNLPYTWENVNLPHLALDAVHFARLGLDMQEKNHLFPIPYKNKNTEKYEITFMQGYSGVQYLSEKYAITPPKSVTVELVYSTDTFKPVKKSRTNPVESYEYEITNPFDRGEIIGGFGYIEYEEPAKNTLVILSLKEILKRKPKYASAEFWGGTVTRWENGKKTSAETDGWFEEMCRKTVIREVYSTKYIPRDPAKIDDSYQYIKEREIVYAEAEISQESSENTGTVPIDIADAGTGTAQQFPAGTETAQSESNPVNAEDLF
jgi:recombination protein RecT